MARTIEVIKTPDGPAPEWVRRQWVGVQMEAVPMPELSAALGGLLDDAPNGDGFAVNLEEALRNLGEKSPKAAKWFRKNFPPGPISFGSHEVVVVP